MCQRGALRPPSSRPSPQGEGETSAVSFEIRATGFAGQFSVSRNHPPRCPLLGERKQVRAGVMTKFIPAFVHRQASCAGPARPVAPADFRVAAFGRKPPSKILVTVCGALPRRRYLRMVALSKKQTTLFQPFGHRGHFHDHGWSIHNPWRCINTYWRSKNTYCWCINTHWRRINTYWRTIHNPWRSKNTY